MFIKTNNKTHEEETISSEEMVSVLESEFKADEVDEILTEIVSGIYQHRTSVAIYKYKA
ncbi:hypothetical protein MMIC_P2347 [Mariprofundus micogutta]|uniref:Uncharacterized protein n=1 Tax=Mariprofundus micogutta TaxID=1921010 RepID=A0A1L8CR32_9PROT|nr:N-carbamoyl-L-amino acid amidohydrolase [Mariprofundus micogutta]GAV21363.1 hypothetical protein MMIC_P2347 [Mariprofundus micogutta]